MRSTASLLATVFTALPVFACSCDWPSVEGAVGWASSVFAGHVVALRVEDSEIVCTFDDIDPLKGVEDGATSVEVRTSRAASACGYTFQLDRSYLVYARERDGALRTDTCHRTRPLLDTNWDDPDSMEPNRAGEEEVEIVRAMLANPERKPNKVVEPTPVTFPELREEESAR